MYLKVVGVGVGAMVVLMFAVFSIYWGALWKVPTRNFAGWVVDFDGSTVGSAVVQALLSSSVSSSGKVSWTNRSASEFPGGVDDVAGAVVDQQTWVAVVVHPNTTRLLESAVLSVNASYDGSVALTAFAVEARNENAYRVLIRPSVEATLNAVTIGIAKSFVKQVGSAYPEIIANISTTAPQILAEPVGYTLDNLRPFDVPVASAMTFVGLIYVLVLAFFIVNFSAAAREMSGLETSLTTWSLIFLRLASSFISYFVLALFYSLLCLAFQVDFSRTFGHSGFVLFWMLNYVGMLAVGLSLEAMLTLLTTRFVGFYMIFMIISNISVCFMPLEVLPGIFRYGYAFPFYNVSGAVRTILFGTKNQLGLQFGILLAWMGVSLITLPLFQWWFRSRDAAKAAVARQSGEEDS
ncbi:uncharacterized protein BT62DRAFT_982520 [Guyanagaster necrorhizus]|uniref:DUF3533 domain-containing protein n=1 Tax=Guyanagaster necrorhizus TaxID=856835 RepID=A0A9P8ANW4_9AGAR|nr:uncharacterized protein BT62DRAFT_982520 [Guyanagaster necrorhizus MCA 3950]KAG7442294.1 hypothetical protein BT62DRAFT_982520 [Guyanagaster necrorhizus MCA 3950]